MTEQMLGQTAVKKNLGQLVPEKAGVHTIHDIRRRSISGYSVEIVQTEDHFRTLQQEWNMLASTFRNPLLGFDWFFSAYEATRSSGDLHIICVFENSRLIAIAPFVRISRWFGPCLELLGSQVLQEPAGFLYNDQRSLTFLVKYIFSLRVPVHFGRLDCSSPEYQLVIQYGRRFWSIMNEKRLASPWIPILTSWELFERGMSSSRKSVIRRSLRRAEELGTVLMEIITPEERDVEKYLTEIEEVEGKSWKGRMGTSIGADKTLRTFFSGFCRRAARRGMCKMSFFRIGGEAVAVQIGVEAFDRLWVLKIGFNERYARCAPGVTLMHFIVKDSFNKLFQSVELLGSDEVWLHQWTTSVRKNAFVSTYPLSLNGIVSCCESAIRSTLQRIKNRKH